MPVCDCSASRFTLSVNAVAQLPLAGFSAPAGAFVFST